MNHRQPQVGVQLLAMLRDAEGEPLGFNEICRRLWSAPLDYAYQRNISVHVARLKAKGYPIELYNRVGYRLPNDACCPTCARRLLPRVRS